MTSLSKTLQEIKKKKIGMMTHVVVGYPTLLATEEIIHTMVESGVDIIELQIPFSDPIADGPTIMKACEKALKQNTKVKDAFILMKKVSRLKTPLLFMAYYNTVFTYGTEKFCQDAANAGCAGLIIPDIPLEEEGEEHFLALCKKYQIPAIRVISPSTTKKRLIKNAKVAESFVYCTARQGITGAKSSLSPLLSSYLKKVNQYIPLPLAVGFGISRPEHIRALVGKAEIAVVGSALIEVIQRSQNGQIEANVRKFIQSLQI